MPQPRFELKYRISEATADVVRGYARAFVAPDRYADPVTYSYPVDSLYYDSDGLHTFWNAVNGARRRYKLRVRTYNDHPSTPVFFEVKRCIDDMIVKERGAVRREAVEKILAGWLPEREDMINFDPSHFEAVENFVRLMQQIDAKPKAFVRYVREAWIGIDDPEVRLTMDREVAVRPKTVTDFNAGNVSDSAAKPFGDTVILEFKFFREMPFWFPDLARITGLRLSPAAKYCEGLVLHGLHEFSPVDWPVIPPSVAPLPAPASPELAPASFLAQLGLRAAARIGQRDTTGAVAAVRRAA